MTKRKHWGKLPACLLAAGLLLVSCQNNAPPQGGPSPDPGLPRVERVQKEFGELEYVRPDLDGMNAKVDDALALAKESGKETELLALYQEILEDIQNLDTMDTLASIRYDLDVTDESYEKEMTDLDEFYTKFDNRMNELTGAILESEYADAAKAAWGEGFIARYEVNSKLNSPEIEELSKQELDLVNEYKKLSVQDYTTELNGKTVTIADLDLTSQEGVLAYYEIYARRNEELGEIYRELVTIRVEIAKKLGYDSYTDYAYDVLGRDYTKEDAAVFAAKVKETLVPLSLEIDEQYYDTISETRAGLDAAFEDGMPILEKALKEGGYPEAMSEAFDYMKTWKMYDFSDSANKTQAGYTTILNQWSAPFLFVNTSVYTDPSTLFHEFGHYYNFFRMGPAIWNDGNNLDGAEIHSQGLEVLMFDTYEELYGVDAAENMRAATLQNLLGSVLQGCAEDEFQQKVFENPEMTLDEMNTLHAEIYQEYIGYPLVYEWVDIHHHFETPFYYISYATSAISALEIWEVSASDRGEAMDLYSRITRYTLNYEYREALKESGLSDPFDSDCVELVAGALKKELNLKGKGLFNRAA